MCLSKGSVSALQAATICVTDRERCQSEQSTSAAFFDAALYDLRNNVLMMSSLTDRMFETAFALLASGSVAA
jgi:hypothetical protein